uniref:Uncharacterized protein n=1 Tax=Myoviridae sp. ctLYp5 TaxID=2827680 RepID=A0A8S5SWW5_9CAUD|nr:MAG TPA: hypothetical protein [Myoviridae sp. ctLYp5]
MEFHRTNLSKKPNDTAPATGGLFKRLETVA